ncbi:hypothetical protein LSA03_15840 [Pediococcus argentinicus]|nr:hypothetical protein LSA03_15840 [Pediococcus argentinicus]
MAKSTINYELHRVIPYNAKLAQLDADQKRKNCGRKTKLTIELETKIINHLKLTLSPSMVARELNIATSSIYN